MYEIVSGKCRRDYDSSYIQNLKKLKVESECGWVGLNIGKT